MHIFDNKMLNFEVLNNVSFSPSFVLLNKLYRPIIGSISTELYKFLFEYINHLKIHKNEKQSIISICKNLSIEINEFNIARQQLEAIGLLKTYYNEIDNFLSFQLLLPLEFPNFIQDKRFYNLLNQKYTSDEIEIMGLQLIDKVNYSIQNEITTSITSIFQNDKFDDFTFNFNLLYEKVTKIVKTAWVLNIEIKQIIENYHKNYKLSFNSIFEACINSFNNINQDQYLIDENLLLNFLDNAVVEQNKIDKNLVVCLNRDPSIYENEVFDISTHPVFLDYRNNDSIKYLASIKKDVLTDKEFNFIVNILKKFGVKQEVFNLVIDYSIYKTYGSINMIYIEKTIQTISSLAINNLNDAYQYFLYLSNKKSGKKRQNIVEEKNNKVQIKAENFDFDFD